MNERTRMFEYGFWGGVAGVLTLTVASCFLDGDIREKRRELESNPAVREYKELNSEAGTRGLQRSLIGLATGACAGLLYCRFRTYRKSCREERARRKE